MEDWALIRRLAAEGEPKARIAARLGISRTTVAKAVASESPPQYEGRAGPTSFTPFEVRVRELLEETSTMPSAVLAERVGWPGSIRWFSDKGLLKVLLTPGPHDLLGLCWEDGSHADEVHG